MIHDQFCRCRICKPPLSDPDYRLPPAGAAWALASVAVALIALLASMNA